MKAFLALCLLFGAANAISLDALRSMLAEELEEREEEKKVSLREYLDTLETPHPYYRSLEARAELGSDCKTVCGAPPTTDHSSQKCASKKWVPNYEKTGSCECLTEYKCCDGTCPVANVESCWANNKKGLLYGTKDVDCCGCEVVKCRTCTPVDTKPEVCPSTRPLSCYSYNPTAKHQKVTGCFEPTCTEDPSDAPPNESCDADCEVSDARTSACGFPYSVCIGSRFVAACPKAQVGDNTPKLPLACYESPTEVADPTGGKYYDSKLDSCVQCNKWAYAKKSCNAKNAATAAASCHQVGANELDNKCMKKTILPDECLCNKHECTVAHSETESKFKSGEVCPKNHVKITGTSICGVARDVCFPCPAYVEKKDVRCVFGAVSLVKDANGCSNNVCLPPTIIAGDITRCKDPTSGAKFTLDPTANTLRCT